MAAVVVVLVLPVVVAVVAVVVLVVLVVVLVVQVVSVVVELVVLTKTQTFARFSISLEIESGVGIHSHQTNDRRTLTNYFVCWQLIIDN